MTKERLVGHIAAAGTIIMWSATYTSTKVLLESFSPANILVMRFVVAYIALWLVRPKMIPFTTIKKELPFMGMGLCGVALYYVFQNTALSLTSATNVSVLIPLAPLMTAVLSQIVFKDRVLTPRFAMGCIIALAGVVAITLNGRFVLELSPVGDLLAILAAASWAGYSIFIRMTEGEDYDPIAFTRRIFFWGLLFLAPCLPFLGFTMDFAALAEPVNLWNMLFLALGASTVGYLSWNFAVKRLGVITSSLYIYMDPICSVAIAATVLHERVTWLAIGGIALILTGLLVTTRRAEENA